MFKHVFSTLAVLALAAADGQACPRCGILGRVNVGVAASPAVTVTAPAVQVFQPPPVLMQPPPVVTVTPPVVQQRIVQDPPVTYQPPPRVETLVTPGTQTVVQPPAYLVQQPPLLAYQQATYYQPGFVGVGVSAPFVNVGVGVGGFGLFGGGFHRSSFHLRVR